jgi:LmbE family N-acetylglucosaminyl deacetylase
VLTDADPAHLRSQQWNSMTQGLDLDNKTRLLIVVPHPDDETLATGALILAAISAGAALRVVVVTDGDNNPWPQRWFEKRWSMDAEARVRWGLRRREEAASALARLGVAEQDVRYYGWPDQGLTALLMHDSRSEDQLVREILEFAPTLIVAPSLVDKHPDHNAIRVMLELALVRTRFAECRRLAFVVHGRPPGQDRVSVGETPEQSGIKRDALQCHTSQLLLSARRMTRICERIERFESIEPPSPQVESVLRLDWRMPLSPRIRWRQRALQLIVAFEGQTVRECLHLPRKFGNVAREIVVQEANSLHVHVRRSINELHIELQGDQAIRRVFAKVQRLGSRILIYDADGWMQPSG